MNTTMWVAALALLGIASRGAKRGAAGGRGRERAVLQRRADEPAPHPVRRGLARPRPGTAALTAAWCTPTAPFTPEEREAWDQAVRYYDRELASKDLRRRGDGLHQVRARAHRPRRPGHRTGPARRPAGGAPDLPPRFWAEHDRVNRAWIAVVAERMATLAPETIPRLETLYGTRWFATPERADVVWVGNWAGALHDRWSAACHDVEHASRHAGPVAGRRDRVSRGTRTSSSSISRSGWTPRSART